MKIDKNSTVSNISRLTQISQQFPLTTSGYLVVDRKVFLFVDDPSHSIEKKEVKEKKRRLTVN